MPSFHPAMISPSMVDFNEFELIQDVESFFEAEPIDDALKQFDLTIEQVLSKYPNVTHFKIKNWIEGSVGDVCDKPRHIEMIDSDGNGFTLLGKGCVSKISAFVKFNAANYVKFTA